MITIMGATGNVGSKITNLLLKRGEKIRVIGRDASKLALVQSQRAEVAIGDAADADFLTKAFTGSSAVFTMIPPNYSAASFGAHYDRVSEAIVKAIQASKVSHVVNLSSIGAEIPEGTGPIKSLYKHEQRLNQLGEVHILHLRPAYFMENLLMNIPFIQSQEIMGGAIKGEIEFPMIATADIAQVAANKLTERDYVGHSSQLLLGERDVSLNKAAQLVSEKLQKKIPYITFDGASTKAALVGLGLSEDSANLFVEMSEAINTELIQSALRTTQNSTPTSLEKFVQEVFPL